MTKKDLCEGLGKASDWWEIKNSELSYIKQKVEWLSKQIGSVKPFIITIEKTTISPRALTCYGSAMFYLISKEFSDSLHQIHDFIYEFGESLEKPISDLEYLLLAQWIETFNFCYTQTSNDKNV
ncbi:hypothetical protein JYT99_02610 [bacterium AH-315-E09]|nr:hypothetical protein [bacterium AH-315-E09]